MKSWNDFNLDKTWTLFLDRDGVINKKLDGDYVKNIEEFQFIDGSIDAIRKFNTLFQRVVIVTNQQGIGKGLMTESELDVVHSHMLDGLNSLGASIDKVYFCPELAEKNAPCRKPNPGMALNAQEDYPEIDFSKSIMVGDSISDLEMGKKVGMITVYIHHSQASHALADFIYPTLFDFAKDLSLRD